MLGTGERDLIPSGRPGMGVILAAVGIHLAILAALVVLSTRARLPAANPHGGVAIGEGGARPGQSPAPATRPWSCVAGAGSAESGKEATTVIASPEICRQVEAAIRASDHVLGTRDFHILLTRERGRVAAELQSPDGHGVWRYLFSDKMDSVRSRERLPHP